jgi:predicted NBD/HSP70 family sugar kinase
MKKTSTVQVFRNEIFKEQKLTIGLDLGDRWSFYCVLDEAGQIFLEQKVATTPEAMKQTFGKLPRSLMALETRKPSLSLRQFDIARVMNFPPDIGRNARAAIGAYSNPRWSSRACGGDSRSR